MYIHKVICTVSILLKIRSKNRRKSSRKNYRYISSKYWSICSMASGRK